jgi:hypothetical protein
MQEFLQVKLWKYMDFAKFASMLTTRSLYFACPTQFSDPYEGLLPRSHVAAESKILQDIIDQNFLALRDQLAARGVPVERFDGVLANLVSQLRAAYEQINGKFGVSCWHESECESDAMWKLYSASGQGIAIESTVEQLKESLGNRSDLTIDRVRYMDFEHDPIEKGHRHYRLFVKRKSFEHEKEIRATVLLPNEGEGVALNCDLDILITTVHVSPTADSFVRDAIEAICTGKQNLVSKPVLQSRMYSVADYGIDINAN